MTRNDTGNSAAKNLQPNNKKFLIVLLHREAGWFRRRSTSSSRVPGSRHPLRNLAPSAVHWRADYEFSVHIPEAKKAGLSEEIIAAVRDGRVPQLDDPELNLAYDFTTAFYTNREVPDALFNKAVARFGRRLVVELVGVLGYYSMLAVLIRVFHVEGLGGFKIK